MKREVNFYTDALRPQVVLLTLNFSLLMWLMAAVVVGYLIFYTVQQHDEALQKQAAMEQQFASDQQLLATLTSTLRERNPDPVLEAKLQQLEAVSSAKQVIIDELQSREVQKQRSFSGLLQALAEHHNPKLWLTTITLDTQQLHVEGKSLSASAVPEWVNGLGRSRFFTGTEFAAVQLSKAEQDVLNFVLSSDPIDTDSVANQVERQP